MNLQKIWRTSAIYGIS